MDNVVVAVFDIESEGYQALSEMRLAPVGEGYAVAEAALLKNDGGKAVLLDGFDTGAVTSNDMANGMIVGSIAGILGGPFGVLLGASYGALVGSVLDSADIADSSSAIMTISNKLFEDEVAIIALVEEEEPAFDEAFKKFDATIIRYDLADVLADVDRARELEGEFIRQARAQLHAERKEELGQRREERLAAAKARFEVVRAKGDKAFEDMKADMRVQAAAAVDAIDTAGDKLTAADKGLLGLD